MLDPQDPKSHTDWIAGDRAHGVDRERPRPDADLNFARPKHGSDWTDETDANDTFSTEPSAAPKPDHDAPQACSDWIESDDQNYAARQSSATSGVRHDRPFAERAGHSARENAGGPSNSRTAGHGQTITPREACVIFGLRNVRSRYRQRPRADQHLSAALSRASPNDCFAAAFAAEVGATPREIHEVSKGAAVAPPFDDFAYCRSLARWLGCPFDAGDGLTELDLATAEVHRVDDGVLVRVRDGPKQLLLLAPTGVWLPRMASVLARTPEIADRTIITTPAALARAGIAADAPAVSWGRLTPLHAIPPTSVADRVLSPPQMAAAMALGAGVIAAAIGATAALATGVIATTTLVLLAFATTRAVAIGTQLEALPRQRVRSAALPVYSVLVPLYREDKGLKLLVRALRRLDYPPDKLDILFLVEADDEGTLCALANEMAELNARIVIVPPGTPRTKPRALNVGLKQARGELVTIYDAEDKPHPEQLRIAAETFAAAPPELAALQARLTIDHMRDNWLTAMFAIEYACLFDKLMPMVTRRGRLVLLGGTSNHFRRDVMIVVGGWDPYNVTEDADLSVRLVRFGYKIAMLPSFTEEEAPVTVWAWLRQRSRWFKGFMQTWLVHHRAPLRLVRELGARNAVLFNLFIIGALTAAVSHFVFTAQIILAMAGLRPLFMGGEVMSVVQTASLLFGYGASFALGAAALSERGRGRLSPLLVLWFPVYWLLLSCAVCLAVWDIVRRPHHWRKTEHGVARRPARLARAITSIRVRAPTLAGRSVFARKNCSMPDDVAAPPMPKL